MFIFLNVSFFSFTCRERPAEDWFNAFFARLWPKIASYVQRLMEDQEGTVTQRMQAAVPKMLKGARACTA